MLNQTSRLTISESEAYDENVRYEFDPCELKLDEMVEAEPLPESIEGMPAPDALTPADRYLELYEQVQSSRIFPDSKTFADCAPKTAPLAILLNYRRAKRYPGFNLICPETTAKSIFRTRTAASRTISTACGRC